MTWKTLPSGAQFLVLGDREYTIESEERYGAMWYVVRRMRLGATLDNVYARGHLVGSFEHMAEAKRAARRDARGTYA